jgi:hypothetical protein
MSEYFKKECRTELYLKYFQSDLKFMQNRPKATDSKTERRLFENQSEFGESLVNTGKSAGKSVQNAIESAKTGKPITRRAAILAGAVLGGAALAYVLAHPINLPRNSTSFQTSTSTVVPQIDQMQINKFSSLANDIQNSVRAAADIINPYAFTSSTTIGDLLVAPSDYFGSCLASIYDKSLALGETNPTKLKQSPHLVSALRLIEQGYTTEGVQKINSLPLGSTFKTQDNDAKKILDMLNVNLTSNDPSSVRNSATLAEYLWTGLTREAYTSRNAGDVQSQIRDFFNFFHGSVPSSDLLSTYYWHYDGEWSNFYSTVDQTLSAFTRYINGRYSVVRNLLDETVANKDAILAISDSDNSFVRKTFGLFTPSAVDGLTKSSADVSILEKYLTEDIQAGDFFWSGQLDTRLTTISQNPDMLRGFNYAWKTFGIGNDGALPQVMRFRPIVALSPWRGPNPSDVMADLQDFEVLKKEAGLGDFPIDSYSYVDPANCLNGMCNEVRKELLYDLRTFLSEKFDPKHTLNVDLYSKYPHLSFATAKNEYETEHRMDGLILNPIYLQIINENVDLISAKYGNPLILYYTQLLGDKGYVYAQSPEFDINGKVYETLVLKPTINDSADIAQIIQRSATNGEISMLNSCFIGDETFYNIHGHPNAQIAKYNSLNI